MNFKIATKKGVRSQMRINKFTDVIVGQKRRIRLAINFLALVLDPDINCGAKTKPERTKNRSTNTPM